MRLQVVSLIAATALSSIALAYHVPQVAPRPLRETQDAAAVEAHREAVARFPKSSVAPVIDPGWIRQIQELAAKNSNREVQPVEVFKVVFKKDGGLAHLEVVIPTSATRTPNQAGQSHGICSADFDFKKGGKLRLKDETKVEGPDDQEIFAVAQLPLVNRELEPLRRLQKAFSNIGLKYTLEADAMVAPDGKSWAWQVASSEEQMPNIIYAMFYYPVLGELHSTPIENAKVRQKVGEAVKAAGLRLTWVKSMEDR